MNLRQTLFLLGFIISINFQLAAQHIEADIDTTNDIENTTQIDTSSFNTEIDEEELLSDENTTSSENADNDENGVDGYYKRTISDNSWNKIKKDKAFIYKTKKPSEKKNSTSKKKKPSIDLTNLFNGFAFKAIMYTLVFSLLILIIWFILKDSDFSYFKPKRKQNNTQTATDWEHIEEFTEWEKALQHALSTKNYRLGVRILYNELLQTMHQKNIIQYKSDRTNWDYIDQLLQSHHLKPFTQLTKYFEYVWYGTFEIDDAQFEQIRVEFSSFKKSIL